MPFSSFDLHPHLIRAIQDVGYTKPTPIQVQALPPALEGRDVLACAQTGSGKTAAFLLPILQHLIGQKRGTTRALIITPTRELAAQIVADVGDLAKHTPVSAAAIFGGVGMAPQEKAFRRGVDIIVATPGRLLDHLGRAYGKLPGITHLVLDEADRMLDMGFLPDIGRILKHIPKKRQTLFFSATMPGPIGKLAGSMLDNPVRLELQRKSAPAAGISQGIYEVPQHLKVDLLLGILKGGAMNQALVFTRTKRRADRVAKQLVKGGVNAERMHGNRSQGQRTQALDGFRSGRYRVLVATDIAARGIDVEALGHVVNFDVPAAPEDYIHRVGRTGRAELTGEAYTFVSRDEQDSLRDIERAVGRNLPRLVLEGFDLSVPAPPKQAGGGARVGRGPRAVRGSVAGAERGARNGTTRGARAGASKGGAKSKAGARGKRAAGARSGSAAASSAAPKAAAAYGIWSTGRRTRSR